jgi:hypothetical protein
MKRKKSKATKRNPIAKAVRKIRPKVVPDTRRKKLDRAKKREEQGLNEG